ncbi:unnamed protein product [marine sediment metagenome]|uniref:Uncharacterized protein n=1 Tax=marine sediment metagenome TaxID=412755 RepID=X1FZB5_9ZZZZ
MEKLTLFNIGLKCDLDQYNGYVAAENASEAEEMARETVLLDHLGRWAQEERDMVIEEMAVEGKTPSEDDLDKIIKGQVEELENMRLTTLIEMGEVLV